MNTENKICEQCLTAFQWYAKGGTKGRFCSKECYAKHQRQTALRMCLCCSKLWYTHRSTKATDGKNAKMFCSRRCSGKYKTWQVNRDARCQCG